MKKSKFFKKTVVLGLSLIMAAATTVVSPAFNTFAKAPDNNVVSPQNIAVVATRNNLTLGSLGKLTCEGYTSVQSGYQAEVVVRLQRYENNTWVTKQTWSARDYDYAAIYEQYYVEHGTYRLKVTHRSYTSGGSMLDNFDKYSDMVTY